LRQQALYIYFGGWRRQSHTPLPDVHGIGYRRTSGFKRQKAATFWRFLFYLIRKFRFAGFKINKKFFPYILLNFEGNRVNNGERTKRKGAMFGRV
jgi:hypothetical protein